MPQPESYTIFTEENFPDENFRNFILNNCYYDSSEQISDEEIIGTNTLNLSGHGISSLKGIEYFTYLECLDCRNNNISVIDITGLQNLDPDKFFYDDGVTINDGQAKPEFKSANLILSGQIGVNFFLDLPEISGVDYYNGESCYMAFDIKGNKTSNNPQPTDGTLKMESGYTGSVFASLNGGRENMAVRQANGTYQVQIASISAHRLADTRDCESYSGKGFHDQSICVDVRVYLYA